MRKPVVTATGERVEKPSRTLLLVTAMAMASFVLAVPQSASAADIAATCYTVADVPQYSGGEVVYSGRINCSRPYSALEVEVNLTMKEGSSSAVEVADTVSYCEDESVCADFGLYPNRSGSQVWCTVVEGWAPGVTVTPARRCETQSW